MLNNHKMGYCRDAEIQEFLESRKVLTTDQIHLLAFSNLENPQMCYRRLRVLCGEEPRKKRKSPRLRRDRFSMSEPYFYWLACEKRPNLNQVPHRIGINWLYVWDYFWAKRVGAKLYWQAEPKEYEPIVRPDSFGAIQTATKLHIRFGEFHRAESNNTFEKIPQYTALLEKINSEKQMGVKTHWWADPFTDQRVELTIVTTGDKKPIEEHVQKTNRLHIPVEILTIEEIKERCFKWQKQ